MTAELASFLACARVMPVLTVPDASTAARLADALAVGASWMATAGHLERGDCDGIRRLTAEAVERSTP
ncbi:hypothetical protein [Streptomyces sp. NPDC046862]|uniref:hypothetical protein n=1 Tax=Streptomyces sp. NPDC046862 TaxID=3154603 RepID=UPI0034539D22